MILTRSSASKVKELAAEKVVAVSKVNRMIGEVRLQFITDIPGQSIIYANKEQEARDYLAADPDGTATNVDLALFPFITKEVGITGPTAYQVAQVFMNLAAVWRQVGSQLEQLRVHYNTVISTAVTQGEISAAIDDLTLTLGDYLGN